MYSSPVVSITFLQIIYFYLCLNGVNGFVGLTGRGHQFHNMIHHHNDLVFIRQITFHQQHHLPCKNSAISLSCTVNDDIDFNATLEEARSMTVVQLKQQLRLYGLKVSGNKSELVERLMSLSTTSKNKYDASSSVSGGNEDLKKAELEKLKNEYIQSKVKAVEGSYVEDGSDVLFDSSSYVKAEILPPRRNDRKSPKQKFAEQDLGKELVDVSAYIEEKEDPAKDNDEDDKESTEVWGADAKVISNFEESPVVDSLQRSIIEYVSVDGEKIKAYVVASRDALKQFLSGGGKTRRDPKAAVLEEVESFNKNLKEENVEFKGDMVKVKQDELEYNVYNTIGASLAALEVPGIMLLSDVYGFENEDNKILCERIAFESQPCVVIMPDLFRGNPWVGDPKSGDYEAWRSEHCSESRVHFDLRATASVLQEKYGVASVSVFGTCFGGGRALEIAAGWQPDMKSQKKIVSEYDLEDLPPLIRPAACVAWYPTRYDVKALFNKSNSSDKNKAAVMAVFAGNDDTPGAQADDANILEELLDSSDFVHDHMVQVFDGEDHGFAHIGCSARDQETNDNAEIAWLLSTGWLDTYRRNFLRTIGPKIKDSEKKWSNNQY